MTDHAWADFDALMSEPTPGDQAHFDQMVAEKSHIAVVHTVVTSWTSDTATFTAKHRQTDNVSGPVDPTIMCQEGHIDHS